MGLIPAFLAAVFLYWWLLINDLLEEIHEDKKAEAALIADGLVLSTNAAAALLPNAASAVANGRNGGAVGGNGGYLTTPVTPATNATVLLNCSPTGRYPNGSLALEVSEVVERESPPLASPLRPQRPPTVVVDSGEPPGAIPMTILSSSSAVDGGVNCGFESKSANGRANHGVRELSMV